MSQQPPITTSPNPNVPSPDPREPEDSMARLMEGPSGGLAAIALILGVMTVLAFFLTVGPHGLSRRYITTISPPSLIAVNFSFVAIMLSVAAIYRIRRLTFQGFTRTVAIAALLLGLLGPFLYSLQTRQWHREAENLEIDNIQRIISAATVYAKAHGGNFPPNLATLLADGSLSGETLISPFTPHAPPAAPATTNPSIAAVKTVDEASDYEYFAGDFKLAYFEANLHFGPEAIAVIAHRPIMGDRLSIGFADGGAAFMESTDEFAQACAANDAIREKVGLPKMSLPTVAKPDAADTTNPTTNP